MEETTAAPEQGSSPTPLSEIIGSAADAPAAPAQSATAAEAATYPPAQPASTQPAEEESDAASMIQVQEAKQALKVAPAMRKRRALGRLRP
mmetsp:Transcript_35597/g.85708  ORF Transcript_35597/g.85708 Transcript_35597/m.85708 type:complete len:91 (-) Transcript_35597:18-290(-)